MIIGVAGLIGSGKGTVSEIISQQYGYQKMAFADTLKDAVSVLFSWPRELLEGDTDASRRFREVPDPFWTRTIGVNETITPRLILQRFGTECMRDVIHPDFWIHALDKKMISLELNSVVITDVRFPNEIEWIRSKGGKVIVVKRGADPDWVDVLRVKGEAYFRENHPNVHESEWSHVLQRMDYMIDNNGSLQDLKSSVEYMMYSFLGGR
jgi:hypothetical protein